MKSYTVDFLTKEVRKNNGEVRQYLIEESHEAIIDPEMFDMVQEKLKEPPTRLTRTRKRHPFAQCIVCGDCGAFYGHKVWHNTTGRYDVWFCNHRYQNAVQCGTPTLRKEEIEAAFTEALSKTGTPDAGYSDDLWWEKVDTVTVYQDCRMSFRFTDGTETEVQI